MAGLHEDGATGAGAGAGAGTGLIMGVEKLPMEIVGPETIPGLVAEM